MNTSIFVKDVFPLHDAYFGVASRTPYLVGQPYMKPYPSDRTVPLLLCSRIRPDHKAKIVSLQFLKHMSQKCKVREFGVTRKPFYPE